MDTIWPQGDADIWWNRITSSLTKFLQKLIKIIDNCDLLSLN